MGSFTGTTLSVLTVSFVAAAPSLSVLGSSLEVSVWFSLGAPSLSALGGSSDPLENNFPRVLPSLESVDSRFSAGGGTTSSTVFSKAASALSSVSSPLSSSLKWALMPLGSAPSVCFFNASATPDKLTVLMFRDPKWLSSSLLIKLRSP
uniref:Putative secreted protein n=1 Tax=Ixodes ricinus TaxID=34613 RepID=A0A6B0UUS5_IXORI